MGLMLSLLVGCAGVLEALACYEHLRYCLLPRGRPSIEHLKKTYDSMVAESLSKSPSRSETWKLGVQGYLDIQGGGKKGPLKAQIKYLGGDEDPVPLLFSTKISSFGQDSFEYESIKPTTPNDRTPSRTPDRSSVKTQEPQSSSFYVQPSPKISPVASRENLSTNFWGDEEEEEKPKEKIQWHYRPLTPNNNTEEAPLPEIHFDSYERKAKTDDDEQPYSEDFLRSLDGIKFRPLQRDDGTGRRRSFKKRHSSSSTSSRESKASREEELKMFTSLEESEFESYKVEPVHSSAPNLSVDHGRQGSRSSSKSPSRKVSTEDVKARKSREKSPSSERPLLKNIAKSPSFDESSELTTESDLQGSSAAEAESDPVVFRKTGVN